MKTKTKAVKKKAVKRVAKKQSCSVSIKVMGKVYKATGASVSEAIGNLKPGNVKGVGVLIVGTKERILMPNVVYRLFNSHGIGRDIAIKNISLLFGV